MADKGDEQTPAERIAELYEQAETAAAQASERLVGSGGFASLLGQLAENAAALTKLSADAMDVALRNLRLAGRQDVIRLARQLARTEDKLERVLQEIEAVQDRLDGASSDNGSSTAPQSKPLLGESSRPLRPVTTRPRRK